MRINYAELVNICQHRNRSVQFSPGLTAIIGRNGSGKSNLLKAIYAAITNDFGRNDGVRIDNICQMAGKSDESRITVELEHNGNILNVTRSLRPYISNLRVTDVNKTEIIYSKGGDINEAMFGLLGVSAKMISDYVFVDQWSIFSFLSMIPSERAQTFQRLFKTEQASDLFKVITKHMSGIVVPPVGVDKDILLARLQEHKYRRDALVKDLSVIPESLTDEEITACKLILAQWEEYKRKNGRLAILIDSYTKIETGIKKLEVELKTLTDAVSNMTSYTTTTQTEYEKANRLLQNWDSYVSTYSNYKDLVQVRDNVKETLSSLIPPNKPEIVLIGKEQDPKWNDWWNEYKALSSKLISTEFFTKMLDSDSPFCPTCGTPRQDLEKYREAYAVDIEVIKNNFDKKEKELNQTIAYNKALEDHLNDKTRFQQEFDNLNTQIERYPAFERLDKPKHELIDFVSSYQSASKNIVSLKDEVSDIKVKLGTQQSLLNEKQAEINEVRSKLSMFDISREDVDKAIVKMDTDNIAFRQKISKQAELDLLNRSIDDDTSMLAEVNVLLNRAAVENNWLAYCESMKNVLHRDSLPKIVSKHYLECMQAEINTMLARFDSPFSISTDDSLSFIASFKDGRKQPAGRLSGGEKVLLSLAFRVVVNNLFVKDLGLLCLDEPTDGLDDINIRCLKVAIEQLKEFSSTRGLQIIIITHSNDLSNLFDHVIEIT